MEMVCPRPMQRTRRSGRIAKELDIFLLGTDSAGKVFSEQTNTVVLSRHGAGLVSRYRFAPDEIFTLRLLGSNKEAEIRLIGQIGGEPGRYVYGVTFVDPDPHFWPMEFPPPEAFESDSSLIVLECSRCHMRKTVEHYEIEEDVYSVNGNILRYCADCGTSTPWKKTEDAVASVLSMSPAHTFPGSSELARGETILVSPANSVQSNFTSSHPLPLPNSSRSLHDSPAPAKTFEPAIAPPHSPASSYSASSVISEFASMAEILIKPAEASVIAVLEPLEPPIGGPTRQIAPFAAKLHDIPARELDASGKRVNKRRHVRIRVSFSACVRQEGSTDELVECENVSKGGVCFHSLQHYVLDSLIEVAAPFSPGETALFVPAQIKRIEALSGNLVFRYGVEYLKPASSKPSR